MIKSKLRIIGGKFSGRKITFNCNQPTLRPTLDRVRETAFNWLAPYIVNTNCLDLFAGSGIFSFEALSRGAKFGCAVDSNLLVYQDIVYNQQHLKITEQQLQIINQDVLWFLSNSDHPILKHTKFNIAFLDPPYANRSLLLESLNILANSDFMAPSSKIYFECDKEPSIFIDHRFPSGLEVFKSSHTGRIGFYLLNIKS